jgi:hypothetical protein
MAHPNGRRPARDRTPQAVTYQPPTAQRFVIAVACLIILVSAIGLIRHTLRFSRTKRHKIPSSTWTQ